MPITGTSISKALNVCTVPALVAVEVATEPNIPLQIEEIVSLNLDQIKDNVLSTKSQLNAISLPTNLKVEYSSFASKEIFEEFKDSLESDTKHHDIGHIPENLYRNNDSIELDSLEEISLPMNQQLGRRSSKESLITERQRSKLANREHGNDSRVERDGFFDTPDDNTETKKQILPGRLENDVNTVNFRYSELENTVFP